MKDFCRYVATASGQLATITGTVKQWDDLTSYEQTSIVEIFANLIRESVLHPPPFCRLCLQDTCPALENKGRCPAERPLRWLASDLTSTRRPRSKGPSRRKAKPLKLAQFLKRL